MTILLLKFIQHCKIFTTIYIIDTNSKELLPSFTIYTNQTPLTSIFNSYNSGNSSK